MPTFDFKLVSFVEHLLILNVSGYGWSGSPSIESW